jgi:hypothetical protein
MWRSEPDMLAHLRVHRNMLLRLAADMQFLPDPHEVALHRMIASGSLSHPSATIRTCSDSAVDHTSIGGLDASTGTRLGHRMSRRALKGVC